MDTTYELGYHSQLPLIYFSCFRPTLQAVSRMGSPIMFLSQFSYLFLSFVATERLRVLSSYFPWCPVCEGGVSQDVYKVHSLDTVTKMNSYDQVPNLECGRVEFPTRKSVRPSIHARPVLRLFQPKFFSKASKCHKKFQAALRMNSFRIRFAKGWVGSNNEQR